MYAFSVLGKASIVCEPLSCPDAIATEHLSRWLGSTQWAVTFRKPLLLALQQSVVVAMKSVPDIAFLYFYISFYLRHSLIHLMS